MRPIVGNRVLALIACLPSLPLCPLAAATGATALGCRHAPTVEVQAQADAGAAAAAAVGGEAAQVLARVGDRTITVADYEAALEHMDQFDRVRYLAPEHRKELLAEMIDVSLLADEARAQGYDQDPSVKQEIREILRDSMLETMRDGGPTPDDIPAPEVAAYFEAHRADFREPERRRVAAIVLPAGSPVAPVLEAAKTATPAQWGELVRARSVDAQAKADVPVDLAGDMGFVSPPGDPRGLNVRVPEAVRAAVFEIPAVGAVLPRAISAGERVWIVKLAGKNDAHDHTLQEAERSIRVKLAADKAAARQGELLQRLRSQYPVKVDEAALAQVKVDAPAPQGKLDAPASEAGAP
jgi:DNA-directed RNA polymerase subunit F